MMGAMHGEAERYIDSCGEYTGEYEREKVLKDWAAKDRVAEKVADDFERRAGALRGRSLLDAGFGNGAFVAAFAARGAHVSGVEVNETLFSIASERLRERGLTADLRLYDGRTFPFADASFDYAYSTSVLEHVSDPKLFLQEIARVLRPGGRAYISFPNRFAPRETHTGVWFLSYLPRSAAGQLLRLFGRNTIAEINLHFISFSALRRLLRGSGLAVVEEKGGTGARRLVKSALARLGIHHSALLRTVMVILEKR